MDIWLLPNNNRWVLPNFSHGQFVEVVGTCSEPSASISDPLTGSKALTGRAGSKEGGKKGSAAVLMALENQAKRTGMGLRAVLLMHEGQLRFVVPTLAALMAWCQQGQ